MDMNNNNFKIGNCLIGEGAPVFIIAEIAQAHDGSLGMAHAYIDAVAKTGANAIKFQTHIANAESSPDEKFRVNCFPQDATRFDYWKRMEFSRKQWRDLAAHTLDKGLIFLSSPFSMEAVDLLEELNVAAWKIGSGETSNLPMLEKIAATGKPVLLSTGMSSWTEIGEAISTVRSRGADLAVFQCTTSYPCPPEKIGLNLLSEFQARYGCPVGLSDHSGTIFPSLAAVPLGAKLIEIHTVFSKECFGPDVNSSVTLGELGQLVQGVRFIESILNSPIDKDEQSIQLAELSRLFGKSLYARRDLPKGHALSIDDLSLKKPGTGIPAKHLVHVIGKVLKKDYQENSQLKLEDLE
jgi:N,N'-diacetyllegionaminate synthase